MRDSSSDIKNIIIDAIRNFVEAENKVKAIWQEPIVGFADARSEYIRSLKEIVHKDHQMPEEVLQDASIIVVYYLPFEEWVTASNFANHEEDGRGGKAKHAASAHWAECYELTNEMMGRLNEHLKKNINEMGYEAKVAPEAQVFYRDEVISHWSFRHLAYAAGLGTFGINNMLITEKGCSGRFNTVVTNLDVEPDSPREDEACLWKKNRACGICIKRCPAGALTEDGFDRNRCYKQCLKNADIHKSFGSSYGAGADGEEFGSEVCGKCVAGLPCAHIHRR